MVKDHRAHYITIKAPKFHMSYGCLGKHQMTYKPSGMVWSESLFTMLLLLASITAIEAVNCVSTFNVCN